MVNIGRRGYGLACGISIHARPWTAGGTSDFSGPELLEQHARLVSG